MRGIKAYFPFILSISLIAIPLFLFAGSTGTITGTVTDKKTGQPLIGASVLVDGTTIGAKSGFDGSFIINQVNPGVHRLIVRAVGYGETTIDSVTVRADSVTTVSVTLQQQPIDLGMEATVKAQREKIHINQIGKVSIRRQEGTTRSPTADIQGFGSPQPVNCRPQQYPPAHGGNAIVNNEPYDAMFFKHYGVNPFVDTEDDHLSTFAADVDDASYIMTRSYLERGFLPPEDAVRTEEFVNHFDYGYRAPSRDPFAVYLDGAPSRFGENCMLLKIGIKGRELFSEERRPANLTFVIDVSGSMQREDRLELVKRGLTYLVDQLLPWDNVAIAIYGSRGEVLLRPTSARNRSRILESIHALRPGGATNAEEGIRIGYHLAEEMLSPNCINRVILCSDGVANVGKTGPDQILREIKRHADRGITLTTVGFGMGNYNDVLMEQLGDKGDGHYAYVDDIAEARRVFVENLTGMLQVIARDVKIQVDFDPNVVRSYRLLGYENRDVADDKFRDDREDGGEIGAGHEVTALYEIKLHDRFESYYRFGDLGIVQIRYKDDANGRVQEITQPIKRGDFARSFREASPELKLAAAAAEFAEILRKSYWAKGSRLSDVLAVAKESYSRKDSDERRELIRLIRRAMDIDDLLADER